jgi:DNA replication protein DnaC
MSFLIYERLHQNLADLGLTTIDEILDNYLEYAGNEEKSVLEILDYLMDEERKSREKRRTERNLRMSGLPFQKTVDDFNFEFQPSIDMSAIKDLLTLKFVHNAENVVFLGPPGVGKTHLAVALGMASIHAGMQVYFINASNLIEKLLNAYNQGKLQRYLNTLSKYQLLIIDEIGYLPFDSDAAYCFFQLICTRYEKRSIVFTSNKSYSQWGEIFLDTVIASAILDRVLHHCTTVNIKGDSYRMKERQKTGRVPPVSGELIEKLK